MYAAGLPFPILICANEILFPFWCPKSFTLRARGCKISIYRLSDWPRYKLDRGQPRCSIVRIYHLSIWWAKFYVSITCHSAGNQKKIIISLSASRSPVCTAARVWRICFGCVLSIIFHIMGNKSLKIPSGYGTQPHTTNTESEMFKVSNNRWQGH